MYNYVKSLIFSGFLSNAVRRIRDMGYRCTGDAFRKVARILGNTVRVVWTSCKSLIVVLCVHLVDSHSLTSLICILVIIVGFCA